MPREVPYEVRLAPAALRALGKLEPTPRARVVKALRREAARAAPGRTGERRGRQVKAIHGRADRFLRLRAGEHRVMYDLLDDQRTVLVLGVVHRRDLERWLRGR